MSYSVLRNDEDPEGVEMNQLGVDDEMGPLPTTNPEDEANILSRWSFWYLNPMFKLGASRPLEEEDIPPLSHRDESVLVSEQFARAWEEETKKDADRVSLPLAFNRAFGWYFWMAALWKLVNDLVQFVQPLMISLITAFIADKEQPIWQGLLYCLVLLVAPTVQSLAIHQYFHQCFRTGMHLRTACTTFVYRKAIRLSNFVRRSTTLGEIANLMSTDSRRLLDLTPYLQTLWSAPLQILVSMALLYRFLGPSSFAGLATLVLMIPVNALIARFQASLQTELMKHKDERVRLMNEYLNGMRVIKFFSWESSFRTVVEVVRDRELHVLIKYGILSAVGSIAWTMTPIFVSVASFATFVALGHDLTNEVIFPSIAVFNILRFPISMFPRVVSSVVSAKVSFDRLQSFLLQKELPSLTDPNYSRTHDLPLDPNEPVVSLQQAAFSWNEEVEETEEEEAAAAGQKKNNSSLPQPVLSNVTLDIPQGQLVVIIGAVGAGKSSLLSGLLGEMNLLAGEVVLRGKVAYVPQTAWMKNDTVKDNITFGEEYDERRFSETVRVCGLEPDLRILPGGEQCEIGEKGINLSGGQKQRISIARAVYSNPDVVLMDDPLSAVDIHVGTHIYEECILKHLAGKTRLLVTHQLYTLSRADLIVYMENGEITEVGTYDRLIEDQGGFAEMVRTHMGTDRHESDGPSDNDDDGEEGKKKKEEEGGDGEESKDGDASKKKKKDDEDKGNAGLIMREERDIGSVKMSVYKAYASNVGWVLLVPLLTLPGVTQILTIGSNYWLSYWGAQMAAHTTEPQSYFMTIFLALSFSAGLSTFLAAIVLAIGAIRAARRIHEHTLTRVFRATLGFFESTPIGRILNRFSKDQDCIDNSLPSTMQSFITCLASVAGTVVLVLVASPFFLLALVPLALAYYYTSKYYLETSRELKRLDSNTNSPIYAHFSETLNGVTTIHAYDANDRFIEENERRLDRNLKLYFPMVASNRWLAARLEFIATLVSVFVGLAAVLTRDWVDSGLIGLALTYCLGITGALSWLVRMATDTETQMNAVERMVQYQNVPQEPELSTARDPDASWPASGRIRFSDVSMRYRPDLPPALRQVTADISPLEKIGIVGRTGSGKSSLVATLFRFIELDSGSITLDGVNIANIGLSPLRQAIAIIPQDPVLFSGTIRSNLDPFNEYDDHQLWSVLARVDLAKVINELPNSLESEVSEGGENFSLGQRQLFCLARALLKNARILILDEATSAVDVATDHLIQKAIRGNLNATILTVAHRLNTIIDYDRIMVLDQGHLVEFDSPHALLADSNSIFAGMVGNNTRLRDMAAAKAAQGNPTEALSIEFDSD